MNSSNSIIKLTDSFDSIIEKKNYTTEYIKDYFNIKTVEDFIKILPYKHTIIKKLNKISEINDDLVKLEVEVQGKIIDIEEKKGTKSIYLSAKLIDESGEVNLFWFRNIENIKKYITLYTSEVTVICEVSIFNNNFSFIHPKITKKTIDKDKILPIYHSVNISKGKTINSKLFRKINEKIFKNLAIFTDYLPIHIIKKYKLMDEYQALKNIHLPENLDILKGAVRRLKFDELFLMQLKRLYANIDASLDEGLICNDTSLARDFYINFSNIKMTGDQKKAIIEILNDFKSGKRMNRLLQGDVGTGKTFVAIIGSLFMISSGYQVSFLVPTEVLAKQHYLKILDFFNSKEIKIALLTGNTKQKEKAEILENIKNGEIKLIIGTHSLLNDSIIYKNLGLVIIDEQHKFGVIQRLNVVKESIDFKTKPHILLMTATPIPRTLSMVLYDNFSISSIKEKPSNRKPIKTIHFTESMKKYMYGLIKEELKKGHQIYFIYPLINESEKIDLNNISKAYRELSKEFYYVDIGIVHGEMKQEIKDAEMEKFKNNNTQILISTTVIEVGIDVPNATVIVIEDADRYGLAQLHQIRGRVGRGENQSYCFLVTKNIISKTSRNRINVLLNTNDGFIISEEDLKLRGGGNIFGEEQSGDIKLKIADIYSDINILQAAKNEVISLLNESKDLSKYPLLKEQIEKEYIELGNIV